METSDIVQSIGLMEPQLSVLKSEPCNQSQTRKGLSARQVKICTQSTTVPDLSTQQLNISNQSDKPLDVPRSPQTKPCVRRTKEEDSLSIQSLPAMHDVPKSPRTVHYSETSEDSGLYLTRTKADDNSDDNSDENTFITPSKIYESELQYGTRRFKRVVCKDGTCNITNSHVTDRKRKYLVDIYTTIVDMKWRYNLILFAAAFSISWVFFAVVWYIIAVAHGDDEHVDDSEWKACVVNVYDFPTALLFSIETQHTIGYGVRAMDTNCFIAYVLLMFQSCFGVFIQSMMAGLIFVKLSLPKRRARTIIFSRNAVISKRNGEHCLQFRVGDIRKSHLCGTTIRATLVQGRSLTGGDSMPLCQYPLTIETETNSGDDFVFLVWPVTAVHKITCSSPLWDVSAESLQRKQFEIIVILEGIIDSTGMATQVRTSYLSTEIVWGCRPSPLIASQNEEGEYRIDYSQFHEVVPISMSRFSAKRLANIMRHRSDLYQDEQNFSLEMEPLSKTSSSGHIHMPIKSPRSHWDLVRHRIGSCIVPRRRLGRKRAKSSKYKTALDSQIVMR